MSQTPQSLGLSIPIAPTSPGSLHEGSTGSPSAMRAQAGLGSSTPALMPAPSSWGSPVVAGPEAEFASGPEVAALASVPRSPAVVEARSAPDHSSHDALQSPRGKPTSRLRQVFTSSGVSRPVRCPGGEYFTRCVLKPCSCPEVWERKPTTNRRMAHLRQVHDVSAGEWKKVSSTGAHLEEFLGKEHPPPKKQGLKRSLGGGVKSVSTRCSTCSAKIDGQDAQRKILVRIKARSARQKVLTEAYARRVCVGDTQPQSMRRGMKSFLKTYSGETGADFYWDGPARSSVQDVHKRDEDPHAVRTRTNRKRRKQRKRRKPRRTRRKRKTYRGRSEGKIKYGSMGIEGYRIQNEE